MRERKFKVWDLINKRWIRPYSLKLNIDGSLLAVNEMDGLEIYGVHQVEVVDFTGLKDKNGKEIYEGDIVRVQFNGWSEVQPITWERSGWSAQDPWDTLDFPCQERVEVIGNIYENHELLTKETT